MSKIFVSYRREDSGTIEGRIRDRLVSSFGARAVFMDIDSVPLGVDFREHVKSELVKSSVMLAVVGPKWFGSAEGSSHSRIASGFDPVRVEIEIALQQGTPIIPLLVLGASIPMASDLPESIRNFAFQNAAYVDSGRDFHHHMDQVIRSVSTLLKAGHALSHQPWKMTNRTTLVGSVGFVLLAVAAWFYDSGGYLRFYMPSTQVAVGPISETRADMVMSNSLSPSQQQEGTMEITNIVANDYIEGVFIGIANPEKYCVVVYVHNDMWYIHPYAGQEDGKSFASVTTNGTWRIKTVKRGYLVDQVAAVALDNCGVSNVPPTIGNVGSLKPNHGIFILHLAGTKYQGML